MTATDDARPVPEAGTSSLHGFRALHHPSFRRLHFGFLLQQVGFWTSHLTLQGLVDDLAPDEPFAISVLFAFLFAPALVVAPFAGVVADRFDRRTVMMRAFLAGATVAGVLAVVTWDGREPTLAVVYGLALALGTTFSFLSPAVGALVANTVPPADLASAISLQSMAANLTRMVGPVIAALVIGAGAFAAGFGVFAATSVFAAVVAVNLTVMPAPTAPSTTPAPGEPIVEGVWTRLRQGFDHARERRPVMWSIASVAVISVFGVAHVSLIPSFASDALGEPPGRFAWIVSSTGIGAIVGALSVGYSRTDPSLDRAARHLALYGVALAGFALSPNLPVAMAVQVLVGFFYFTAVTSLQTLVQQRVDDDRRGRVMSLFGVAWGGIVWIGALLLGAVADPLGVGVRPTLVLAGSVCVVYGVATAVLGRDQPTGPAA